MRPIWAASQPVADDEGAASVGEDSDQQQQQQQQVQPQSTPPPYQGEEEGEREGEEEGEDVCHICGASEGDVSLERAGAHVSLIECGDCVEMTCSDCSNADDVCSRCVDDEVGGQLSSPVRCMHGSSDASSPVSAVDESLTCSLCSEDTRQDDDILLCDGGCERGWHLSCLNMTEVPEGDWACSECLTHQRCQQYLKQHRVHRPADWLTPEQLPFKVGAAVVAVYPGQAPHRAEMHFGSVLSIGEDGADEPGMLTVRLRHWPYASNGYPNFIATPEGDEWEELQPFWPFLQYAGIMVPNQDGTAHLSSSDQHRLYKLSEQFRV